MDSSDLRLEHGINQSMAGKHVLALELRRNDNRLERLSTATCIRVSLYRSSTTSSQNRAISLGKNVEIPYQTSPQSPHAAPAAAPSASPSANPPSRRRLCLPLRRSRPRASGPRARRRISADSACGEGSGSFGGAWCGRTLSVFAGAAVPGVDRERMDGLVGGSLDGEDGES